MPFLNIDVLNGILGVLDVEVTNDNRNKLRNQLITSIPDTITSPKEADEDVPKKGSSKKRKADSVPKVGTKKQAVESESATAPTAGRRSSRLQAIVSFAEDDDEEEEDEEEEEEEGEEEGGEEGKGLSEAVRKSSSSSSSVPAPLRQNVRKVTNQPKTLSANPTPLEQCSLPGDDDDEDDDEDDDDNTSGSDDDDEDEEDKVGGK